jgi:hypothetical protein
MGACIAGSNKGKDPLDKRRSSIKQQFELSKPKNEDEAAMIKHRERILKKKKK